MENRIKNLLHELKGIKKYATQEEIEKLCIETLNPDSFAHCVYGQMTGDCFGKRSSELMTLCEVVSSEGNTIEVLNGSRHILTVVEQEIQYNERNNPNLIHFLRDEITEEEFLKTL